MRVEDIPIEAINIHVQNDQFRKYITSLDYTVDSYNNIIKSASRYEKPLINEELVKIDADIVKGEKNLKWNSPNISEYIALVFEKVNDLETRLLKSISNCEKIKSLINTWKDEPLFKRSEVAKVSLLQLDDRQTRLDARFREIKEIGEKIHILVKVNFLI